jgi:hypothetical protein
MFHSESLKQSRVIQLYLAFRTASYGYFIRVLSKGRAHGCRCRYRCRCRRSSATLLSICGIQIALSAIRGDRQILMSWTKETAKGQDASVVLSTSPSKCMVFTKTRLEMEKTVARALGPCGTEPGDGNVRCIGHAPPQPWCDSLVCNI